MKLHSPRREVSRPLASAASLASAHWEDTILSLPFSGRQTVPSTTLRAPSRLNMINSGRLQSFETVQMLIAERFLRATSQCLVEMPSVCRGSFEFEDYKRQSAMEVSKSPAADASSLLFAAVSFRVETTPWGNSSPRFRLMHSLQLA